MTAPTAPSSAQLVSISAAASGAGEASGPGEVSLSMGSGDGSGAALAAAGGGEGGGGAGRDMMGLHTRSTAAGEQQRGGAVVRRMPAVRFRPCKQAAGRVRAW